MSAKFQTQRVKRLSLVQTDINLGCAVLRRNQAQRLMKSPRRLIYLPR
jgi:hypothetical protein